MPVERLAEVTQRIPHGHFYEAMLDVVLLGHAEDLWKRQVVGSGMEQLLRQTNGCCGHDGGQVAA